MTNLPVINKSPLYRPFRYFVLITTILFVTSCSIQTRPSYVYTDDYDYHRDNYINANVQRINHHGYSANNKLRLQNNHHDAVVATHVAGAVFSGLVKHSSHHKKRYKKKLKRKIGYVNASLNRCNPRLSNCYKN